MINCIIVDDEEHAIEVIEHYLNAISAINVAATFTNPIDALTYINEQNIDLIFLDIHMPEISGIDFIQTMNNSSTMVILTSAYKEFAIAGFDLDVVDYLVKPITLPRFLQAITKAQKIINAKAAEIKRIPDDDYLMIKTGAKGKMLKINLDDIDYIEGMKNYIAFHHNGNSTMALLALKDLEERLPKAKFIRVQKSFIIALNKVKAIDGNRIILKGVSVEILIGELYRKDFLDLLKKNMVV